MQEIKNIIENIQNIELMNVATAIVIFLIFRIFSSNFSYIIIRMFNIKVRKKEKIKQNAFYNPLRVFLIFLGLYLAIVYLKEPLGISEVTMKLTLKAFKIITIIIFAKGLAQSITPNSKLVENIRQKLNKEMDDSVFLFSLKVARVIIYIIGGFLSITELGYNLNGLVAGLGISGVIVTLAAQDTAKNLFGGLVIFFDKPFAVGDWIQVDSFEGTVEDITFRSTRVRTFENSVVNIPNANIANASIINWSKMEKRRYRIKICVALNTPLEKIEDFKDKVHGMMQNRKNVLDETIIVKFDEIVENGMNILISSYTDSVDYPSYLAEKEDINYKIMKILKEENIELAYDTKTVYVKN